jgi:hypothetical protein
VRAFVARTEDYDQTIVDLLATPYVRYRGAINPRVVEEVVGRVDQFEGADERLASEVLADTALIRDIAQAESEDERSEKIENAFIAKAKELMARLDEAASREAEIKATAAEAEETAAIERARRVEGEDTLLREQRAHQETETELRRQLEREQAERRRMRVRRW